MAIEKVNKYKPFVYPFMGSGYLTGTEDDVVILINAKKCALFEVDGIIDALSCIREDLVLYWKLVKNEIELLWCQKCFVIEG